MEPGQLCSKLLHKFGVRPGSGKGPHVLQVPGAEALQVGELGLQVTGELVDDLRAPLLLGLLREDALPDVPVQQHQFPVHGQGGPCLRAADAALEVTQERAVLAGEGQVTRHNQAVRDWP